jgi:hypothetical protein
MKIRNIHIILLFFSFLTVESFGVSKTVKYYYAYNKKIYINESNNKFVVRYKQNDEFGKLKKTMGLRSIDKQVVWKDDLCPRRYIAITYL